MREILRNSYMVVTLDRDRLLLRLTRTNTAFPNVDEVRQRWLEASQTGDRILGVGRSRFALLVDLRSAPGRNDPSFEAVMKEVRPIVMRGFRRIGMLMGTAAGALQIVRHSREDGLERMVSSDEDKLLDYLRPGAS